jgi:hypothetical protein
MLPRSFHITALHLLDGLLPHTHRFLVHDLLAHPLVLRQVLPLSR